MADTHGGGDHRRNDSPISTVKVTADVCLNESKT